MEPRGFYEPGEYLGARVYDAHGLLYGRVCGVDYVPVPRLRVCVDPGQPGELPDPAVLAAELGRRGLEPPEALEELILAAREEGVDAPRVPASRLAGRLKGYVAPSEMETVDRVEEGGLLVLLREPREERLSGREPVRQPPPRPELVVGKPVVSGREGYLGTASGIALGPRGVALRVVKRGEAVLELGALSEELASRGYRGVAEQLRRLAPGAGPRAPGELLEALEALLEALKAPAEAREALRSSIRYESVARRDVPWEKVLWAGDAVIVY